MMFFIDSFYVHIDRTDEGEYILYLCPILSQ